MIFINKKIKLISELINIVGKLKQRGKKIVQCHGTFDLVHPGHMEHFRLAKQRGDVLIVSVTADKLVKKRPGGPIFPQDIRLNNLAALECVDYVILDEFGDGPPLIRKLKPDVFVKGPDYAVAANVRGSHTDLEKRAVEAGGGRLYTTPGTIVFSSTELINKYFNPFTKEVSSFLTVFKKKYSYDDVNDWLKKISDKKVLVIGDTIIDEYHYCRPLGMSAKENLISVNYDAEEAFVGGAAATANHVASFCKEVCLFTLLGKDNSREDFIRQHLHKNIKPVFVFRSDGPTVVIRRYIERVFLQKYFQLYFHNSAVLEEFDGQIARKLEPLLQRYDLVLVNDFALGFLGRKTIETICKKAGCLSVNTQTNSSNRGFNLITKYSRADYGCIDHQEIRLAAGDRQSSIPSLIKLMANQLHSSTFTATLGHQGSIGYDAKQKKFYETPVFSKKIVDRVGAGDAYFSVTAPLASIGAPMDIVGFIGNIMGSIAVTIVGNQRSIDYNELAKAIGTILR